MTAPGMLIAGRYRLEQRIAAGGMGWVWEAWDELLHRKVAVKQLLPQLGVTDEDAELARRRLIREARITARLHHPHVVTLYDVVEHADCPCLIMQYVPSRSLTALLQERGALPEAAVLRIAVEVSAGLAAAHEVGIVHRDVKPGNVLITEDGSAKLTDFGISHAAGDANLTATGMVTGTPAYLAPEVARGGSSGFPADVFSFGATIYAALEGSPPFGNDPNPMAVLHRVASGRIIPPRRSGGLTPLLSQMLAVEPGDRPTMGDVAATLAARQAEMSAVPDLLHGLTVAIPPRTIREWPAEVPVEAEAASPGPWQGLVGDLPADPPESVEAPVVEAPLTEPPRSTPVLGSPRKGAHRRGGRRWLWPVVAAVLALVVAGALLVALTSGRTDPTADGASPATTTAGTSSALTTPSSDAAEPAITPSSSAASSAEPSVEETSSEVATPTTSDTPSAAPVAEAPPTPEPTPTPTPSPESAPAAPEEGDGEPTAAELAAFVGDYYASLPDGTGQGWDRLTPAFQNGIARDRDYYERFWGSIADVDLDNVSAAPPGRVEATVTYYFKDGRVSVEQTVYSVVRDGGEFKIDNSEVVSGQ